MFPVEMWIQDMPTTPGSLTKRLQHTPAGRCISAEPEGPLEAGTFSVLHKAWQALARDCCWQYRVPGASAYNSVPWECI